jgi:hypothetical protein
MSTPCVSLSKSEVGDSNDRGQRKLTAIKVPGKKIIPRIVRIFIAVASCIVSSASLILTLASFWAMNW